MGGIVVVTVLALVVAAGVIVAASMWGDESGALRGLWQDLRSVLRGRRHRDAERTATRPTGRVSGHTSELAAVGAGASAGAGSGVVATALGATGLGGSGGTEAGTRAGTDDTPVLDDTPVDVSFAEIFAQDAESEDGYLHLDELAELVERTGERAGRLLHVAHHVGAEAPQVPPSRDPRG